MDNTNIHHICMDEYAWKMPLYLISFLGPNPNLGRSA